MRKLFLLSTLLAGLPLAANATLMLSADINGTTISCADQAACDTNSAVGILSISDQVVGGVQFLGSAQTQVIGPSNSLDTSSFQIINSSGAAVDFQVAVSGTGFQGPVANFSASGSGTYENAPGSTIDMSFYGDPTNTQGATTPTDLPGTKVSDSGVLTAVGSTFAIAFNDTGAFAATNAYSMALGTSGTIINGGSLVGRSQAIVTEQVPAPEPASLAILGIGLLGLTLVRRRA